MNRMTVQALTHAKEDEKETNLKTALKIANMSFNSQNFFHV